MENPTLCSTSLRQAIESNWAPEKIALEADWSARMGLPYRQIQFSHLADAGGVLPSGVVLDHDRTTAHYGKSSSRVGDLYQLGQFLDEHIRPRRSNSWGFVERSGIAFWSMRYLAQATGDQENPVDLLPKTLRENAELTQEGSLSTGDLVFRIQGSSMHIRHQFGIMFSLMLDTGARLDFSSDDTWRRVVIYMAKSGRYAVDLKELESMCPPPHGELNQELADLLGVHVGLLEGCKWSGIPEHVLPLGDGWAILTDAEQRKFSLARDGAVVTREIKGIVDVQIPLMN